MPSFDITSTPNLAEIPNAVQQAQKEIAQRYDFRDTKTEIEIDQDAKGINGIKLNTTDSYKLDAARDMLFQRLAKRGIDLKFFDSGEPEAAGGGRVRQYLTLRQGIATDVAKKIIAAVKAMKHKVTVENRGDEVRVTGKKLDELQEVIAELKTQDFDIPLQFGNYRQ